jgi:hypothetical protein
MKTNRTCTTICLLILQMVICLINMMVIISFLIGHNSNLSRDPEANQNTCYLSSNIQDNSICIYQVLLSIAHLFICLVICLIVVLYTHDYIMIRVAIISLLTIVTIIWSISIPKIDMSITYADRNNIPYQQIRAVVLAFDWFIIANLMITIFMEVWNLMIDYFVVRQIEQHNHHRNEIICDAEPGIIVEIHSVQPNPQRTAPPQQAEIPIVRN